jgi:B-box zinc finger
MDAKAEVGAPRTTAGVCAHHPDRPGHALCMSCRKVVCQECATEWDGINYCVVCLAARRGAARAPSSTVGLLLAVGVSVALFFVAARLMVWVGVLATEIW